MSCSKIPAPLIKIGRLGAIVIRTSQACPFSTEETSGFRMKKRIMLGTKESRPRTLTCMKTMWLNRPITLSSPVTQLGLTTTGAGVWAFCPCVPPASPPVLNVLMGFLPQCPCHWEESPSWVFQRQEQVKDARNVRMLLCALVSTRIANIAASFFFKGESRRTFYIFGVVWVHSDRKGSALAFRGI